MRANDTRPGRHRAAVPTRWGTPVGVLSVRARTSIIAGTAVAVAVTAGMVATRPSSPANDPAAAPSTAHEVVEPAAGESSSGSRARAVRPDPLVSVVSARGTAWVRSTSTSARGVARRAGLTVDADDRVSWAPPSIRSLAGASPVDAVPAARTSRSVVVTFVKRSTTTHTQLIAAPVRRRTDPSVPAGEHVVVSAGSPGEVRTRTLVVTHDGDVVRRDKRVVAKTRPEPRVIAVGLANDPAATPSTEASPAGSDDWPDVPGTEDLNWTALAQCESSNNPRATNPAGYYGLFQFNLGTWASVGGSGNPRDASPAEQLHRAQLLYASRGAQPWPVCGQRL